MLYSFIYVFITAISMVFVQHLDASINPMFSLLVTTIVAIVYFNFVNMYKLKLIYQVCWQHKQLWLSMMLLVFVMRATAMIAPGLIGASLHGFLYFSWLGVLGFLSLSYQDWEKHKSKFYCATFIVCLILFNLAFSLYQTASPKFMLGILCSLTGGTSAFLYFKQSRKAINCMKLSASQILAVRFYLAIPLTLVVMPQHAFSTYLSWHNMISLLILAVISMIIPLYFSQKALEKITSELNAIIMSMCPAVAGLIQETIFGGVHLVQGVIYVFYSLILFGFFISARYSSKVEKKYDKAI